MTMILNLVAFVTAAYFGHVFFRKLFEQLGWKLFRYCHRNNPEALEWADHEQR